MEPELLQLYPPGAKGVALRGLYLGHRLHELWTPGEPCIYADFVMSLDGRIAVRDPATGESMVPRELTSGNDLRLLLELLAQADCIVTNAGYLRAVARGELGDILQVGTVAGHEDLAQWRVANGLRAQPAVCIASASLDFPFPASIERHAQQVFVATGRGASRARIDALEARGYEVLLAGEGPDVQGTALARALAGKGFRSAFLLTGPRMLDASLREGVLARLYVTITHDLLGGEHFRSILEGPSTAGAGRLKLKTLFLDFAEEGRPEQLFAQYEPLHRRSASGR